MKITEEQMKTTIEKHRSAKVNNLDATEHKVYLQLNDENKTEVTYSYFGSNVNELNKKEYSEYQTIFDQKSPFGYILARKEIEISSLDVNNDDEFFDECGDGIKYSFHFKEGDTTSSVTCEPKNKQELQEFIENKMAPYFAGCALLDSGYTNQTGGLTNHNVRDLLNGSNANLKLEVKERVSELPKPLQQSDETAAKVAPFTVDENKQSTAAKTPEEEKTILQNIKALLQKLLVFLGISKKDVEVKATKAIDKALELNQEKTSGKVYKSNAEQECESADIVESKKL